MLYEDKYGNLLMEQEVSKMTPLERRELELHPSRVDEGELC